MTEASQSATSRAAATIRTVGRLAAGIVLMPLIGPPLGSLFLGPGLLKVWAPAVQALISGEPLGLLVIYGNKMGLILVAYSLIATALGLLGLVLLRRRGRLSLRDVTTLGAVVGALPAMVFFAAAMLRGLAFGVWALLAAPVAALVAAVPSGLVGVACAAVFWRVSLRGNPLWAAPPGVAPRDRESPRRASRRTWLSRQRVHRWRAPRASSDRRQGNR